MKGNRGAIFPQLTPDRLDRRLEHFMTEIRTIEHESPVEVRSLKVRRTSSFGRWRVLAGTGAVVAATAGVFVASSVLGGPSGQGPAAFAFQTVGNETIVIKVIKSDVADKQMTEQLRAHGLRHVRVQSLPVTPQWVGRWDGATHYAGTDEPKLVSFDGHTNTLELPVGFDGHETFFIGRAAKPGEHADGGEINALAPGGLLHCMRLAGTDPEVAAAKLRQAGYSPHWLNGILHDGGPDVQDVPAEPTAGSRVTYVAVPAGSLEKWSADSRDVYVRTAQPGSLEYKDKIWRGYPESQIDPDSSPSDYSDCPAS